MPWSPILSCVFMVLGVEPEPHVTQVYSLLPGNLDVAEASGSHAIVT